MLHLDKEIELNIIDLALTHIKKVEADPEVETEGDNFDYWHSYELEDGNFIDYNIHESNFGVEYDDFDGYEWHCSAYQVDPPTKDYPYPKINTDVEEYIFTYSKEKLTLM